ncbi:42958_t:CDS:2, partial [Gigaspora margarita]
TFIQMMFRIHNCEKHILSLYYQKISGEFSRSPDIDSIFYKLDQSPAITLFIEVEHQKCLSTRNFIEILCSLFAITEASLKLIKMDESRGVIGIHKEVCNEIRTKVLVIKHTDFEAIVTSRNLTLEEAEFLKLDSECSVADTIALKHFLCKIFMVEMQGYNEESAIEELNTKDIAQWEDICYNTKDNFENLVAKNLRKTYSVNHWEAIKIAFEASCEKFIKIRSQALLLFGFRSHAKEILDLKSAIKTINTIDLFNSIPIINNITLEHVEHKISDSFSSTIDEKDLSLEMPDQNQSTKLS